jgi:uncharacterized membrane protein YphA (DoxX/SURF4 family)
MDYTPYLVLVGRVLLGLYFVRAGVNHLRHSGMLTGYAASKGVPMPKLAVPASGLLMLLGGLGVLLGYMTTWAVGALVLFLVPTTLMMHQFWKVADPMTRMGEEINFYKNMGLTGAILMLLAIPQPWMWTI